MPDATRLGWAGKKHENGLAICLGVFICWFPLITTLERRRASHMLVFSGIGIWKLGTGVTGFQSNLLVDAIVS